MLLRELVQLLPQLIDAVVSVLLQLVDGHEVLLDRVVRREKVLVLLGDVLQLVAELLSHLLCQA